MSNTLGAYTVAAVHSIPQKDGSSRVQVDLEAQRATSNPQRMQWYYDDPHSARVAVGDQLIVQSIKVIQGPDSAWEK